MKAGYAAGYQVFDQFGNFAQHGLQYQFGFDAATGQVVPNQITQRITPWQQANRTRYDAFYIQDQWTHNRLTLQGALRYEHAWSFFPEGMNGLLADSVFGGPAFTLPEAKGVTGYNDIAPRMGLAYDVFGDGKTAVKVNLSKYLPGGGQRRRLHQRQQGVDVRADGQPRLERRQQELRARLRPAEPGAAGQPGRRRRPVRRAEQRELLRVLAEPLARHCHRREPGAC